MVAAMTTELKVVIIARPIGAACVGCKSFLAQLVQG